MTDKWKSTASALFIGLLIGAGSSNLLVVSRVSETAIQLAALQKETWAMKSDFRDEQKRTDDRVFKLADMVSGSVNQNKEFVALIREQNSLFRQMMEQRQQ